MQHECLPSTGLTFQSIAMCASAALTTYHTLTSSAEASPVRMLPKAESWPALMDNDQDYGESSPDSLASYDRDSSSWRTSQTSFLEIMGDGLGEYSVTWPRSGMMRNGIAYPLPPLVRLTSVIASSLWPTPTAVTASGGAALCKWGGSRSRAKLRKLVTPEELNGALNPGLACWLMGFPPEWSSLTDTETP